MRRILITVLCLALVAAACGSDEALRDTTPTESGTVLDDVEVTGEPGEEPTLEFDMPLEVDETARLVLTEGDGEEVVDGKLVSFDYLFVNSRDGTVVNNSYESEPAELVFED